MTLVVALPGSRSTWLMADRRLSFANGDHRDDACKVVAVETLDGHALIGYAGLGITALGTEPGDWMSRVLRGRALSLEQSLGVLATAIQRELPPHLVRLSTKSGLAHFVLAAAVVNGRPRLYSIELEFSRKRATRRFVFTSHVCPYPGSTPPRVAVAGSGLAHLSGDLASMRIVLKLISAYDRGRIRARAVAKYLASLNHRVHLDVSDRSVGSRCIVVWRNHEGAGHREGSGAAFFDGVTADPGTCAIPTILHGRDINAFIGAIRPYMEARFRRHLAGERDEDIAERGEDFDQMHRDIAALPASPDEKLL
jgi:hypothetical protein